MRPADLQPSCDPNPCHSGVECIVTPNGIKCGACPAGMTGDGTHCEDVDEVCGQPHLGYIPISSKHLYALYTLKGALEVRVQSHEET